MLGFHLLHCRGGKRSMDDGNVDTSLLKYGVRILQPLGVRYCKRARETSTALCPSPVVAFELGGRWVEFLEGGYDPVLEVDDVFLDMDAKSCSHFGVGERRWRVGYRGIKRNTTCINPMT